MQTMALVIAGVVCLMICGLAFFKLVPRDGQQTISWMSDGAAVTVTLILLMLMTIGVGLLISAAAA
jgi:hypothetical protein